MSSWSERRPPIRDRFDRDGGVLWMLHRRVEEYGSIAEVARRAGVSHANVRMAYHALRPIRGRLLSWLGYRTVTAYERVIPPRSSSSAGV